MNRRDYLKVLAVAVPAAGLPAVPADGAPSGFMEMHIDFAVEPGKEETMLANYRNNFRPAISKQPGFIMVNLLKLRRGGADQTPYRLVLAFQTEEQRVAWTKTDAHQASFPTIRDTMAKGSKTNSYDDVV
jgi:heme-degrading monooxygenase HmoA